MTSVRALQVYWSVQGDLYAEHLGYGAALAPAPTRAPVPLADAAVALQLDAAHLREAAELAAGATTGDEASRKRQLVEEWNLWAGRYPATVRPSLQWCSPQNVLVFLTAWRKGRHGRWSGAADCPVAPGTLRSTASRLSAIFASLGRHGPWEPHRPQGNPGQHPHVRAMLAGYERRLFEEEGYSAAGAVPLQEWKYDLLQGHLSERLMGTADPYQRCLLLRDQALFAYLWASGGRGKEGVDLLTSDFCYKDLACTPAWGDIIARKLRDGATVVVECSMGTKTRKTRHPGVVELACGGDAGGVTLLSVLPDYAEAMAARGAPLRDWLFRPGTASENGGFEDAPMTRSAAASRLKDHLEAAGVYLGETAHSFRRGSAQHDKAAGVSKDEIRSKRQWRCEETAELYLHPTRHERRVRRFRAPEGGVNSA